MPAYGITDTFQECAVHPEYSVSNRRMNDLIGAVRRERVGEEILHCLQYNTDKNRLSLNFVFDEHMKGPHGLACSREHKNKVYATIFLNPRKSEDFLVPVMAHEMRHVLQDEPPLQSEETPTGIFLRDFVMLRLAEGDAFVHQFMFSVDAWRRHNNPSYLDETMRHLEKTLPPASVARLHDLSTELRSVRNAGRIRDAAEEIFWLVQPHVAAVYDARFFQSYDDRLASTRTFEHLMERAILQESPRPPDDTATAPDYVGRWLTLTPDVLSSSMGDEKRNGNGLVHQPYLKESGVRISLKLLETLNKKGKESYDRLHVRLSALSKAPLLELLPTPVKSPAPTL